MSDDFVPLPSILDDARAIKLLNKYYMDAKEKDNHMVAEVLHQLVKTISEVGIFALQPNKEQETEIVKSIESEKYYYISTVAMAGHSKNNNQDWWETAVFVCDEDGQVECWNPVYNEGVRSLEESIKVKQQVKISAESGRFDKINPWA
jgi:hypothetical protein